MPRRPQRKEHLSEEEIRERVDRVMDNWRSYPDFAHLFDALLNACGPMDDTELARVYRERMGRSVDSRTIGLYRQGRVIPSYLFVADLADHCLFLPLDPDLFRAATGGCPPGPYRTALFASAGFIEVTPESTREWNREVLAGYDRLLARDTSEPKPAWPQLMRKLIDFPIQGGRATIEGIAERARSETGDLSLLPGTRLTNLLTDGNSVPVEKERLALYQVLGLETDQVRHLEEWIESGRIPLRGKRRSTAFSQMLTEILDRLAAAGISCRCLALMTQGPFVPQSGVANTAFVAWKSGRSAPTLAALRDVTGALRRCVTEDRQRLVTDDEIDALITAAGFEVEEMTATCHDVIARVTDGTRIQPLLWAIRNASDISAPLSAVAEMDRRPPRRPVRLPSERSMGDWEHGTSLYPTADQVRELLDRYNVILGGKGHMQMTAEEIEKVVEVAERDRQCWLEQPVESRATERKRPGISRQVLSPTFEDDPLPKR